MPPHRHRDLPLRYRARRYDAAIHDAVYYLHRVLGDDVDDCSFAELVADLVEAAV